MSGHYTIESICYSSYWATFAKFCYLGVGIGAFTVKRHYVTSGAGTADPSGALEFTFGLGGVNVVDL